MNVLDVDEAGNFKWEMRLDYNPLKINQVPLTNLKSSIKQNEFDLIIGESTGDIPVVYDDLYSPPYGSTGTFPDIAREFIRRFNSDGTQKIDPETGHALIARMPVAAGLIAFVGHVDQQTHGADVGTNECLGRMPPFVPNEFCEHYPLATLFFK